MAMAKGKATIYVRHQKLLDIGYGAIVATPDCVGALFLNTLSQCSDHAVGEIGTRYGRNTSYYRILAGEITPITWREYQHQLVTWKHMVYV